jgi:cobalamin biosynthesis protein CobC
MTTAAPSEAAWRESAIQTFAYHGGNLSAARRMFPSAPHPWIDLSTCVNPHPYPLPELAVQSWSRLPDAAALARLEAAAAKRYRADATAEVVAAPGSQAIIQMLARILPTRRVGVFGASYPGHARAWTAAGAKVVHTERLGALARFDVAVVVNPNNPDGRVVTAARLRDVARNPAPGTLIVDEAFADFDATEQSLATELPEQVIVLRSFGKSYGLPGLRLGFAILSPDLAAALRAALGPWAVSAPAIEVGLSALPNTPWIEATRARLAEEAERLDRLLQSEGWSVIGGTRLFRLAARADASERFFALLRHGVLARPFADAPDRLRFGLPTDETAWRRLTRALGEPPWPA